MITAAGIGSGLDVESIVSQLMTLERRPLDALQTESTAFEAQVSAYGKLKSSLASFQDAMASMKSDAGFKVFTANTSDDTVLTASATSSAAPGQFSLEILRTAEQHRMVSSSAYDGSYQVASNSSMEISVGDGSFTVDIGGMNLQEVAAAINSASDNAGVTASVVNVDDGIHLLLSSNETGSDGALQVNYSGVDPFGMETINKDRDGSGGFSAADLDAVVVLDGGSGLTATRSSNTVTDLITGVTLKLKSQGFAGVEVARDVEGITASAQKFVDGYNALRTGISDARNGDLKGDNSLLTIESRIIGVLNTAAIASDSLYSYLSGVGISIQKDGSMSLDTTAFQSAVGANVPAVTALFSQTDQGFAYRLDSAVTDLLASGGLLDTRTDGLNRQLEDLSSREDQLTRRLDLIEQRYRSQYTALDTLIGQMKTTSDYLTRQLAGL